MTTTEDQILLQWEIARDSGVTRDEFAEHLGITSKALDNKLYRAKKRRDIGMDINDVVDVVDGNYRHLSSKTDRIKTVDDLLKACSVDLSVWQLDDKYEVGSWEMGRRAESKNIQWQDGRIEKGYAEDTGGLHIETLYRVRATLVRKEPKPIAPVIKPIEIHISKPENYQPISSNIKKALIIPDSQMGYRRSQNTGQLVPFHDRRAHDIIMRVASWDDFDTVVYLGDGLDLSEWTDRFVTDPEFYNTTQPAIIEYSWFLSQVRKCLPSSKQYMLLGNHDDRIDQMLQKHLYAAYRLKPSTELELDDPFSMKRLLGLDTLGIEISDKYPNGEVWLGENVRCVHTDGISSKPGGTASKMIGNITQTTVAGHNHSLEYAIKIVDDYHGRRYVTAATCGCLCHLDYRVPGHKKGQNWQQGFGVIYYDQLSPHVELFPIVDGTVIYNGDVFVGEDYADKLTSDTGWKF